MGFLVNSFLGALMHDAPNPHPRLRLAVAPGVQSSKLSALLARQRTEEPDVTLTFCEVAGDALREGLFEGHYDVGLSFEGHNDSTLKTQPLWTETMAIAMPSHLHLFDQAKLTIADLQDFPLYRWQAEICPLLDERLASLMPAGQESVQRVSSFEMMALCVAAGYGVGVSARSRIQCARGWEMTVRPLADGPYEIVTYLQRSSAQANAVAERFERRALQVTRAGAT